MKVTPFTFDSFEEEDKPSEAANALSQNLPEEQVEEEVPSFSEDELNAAKQRAYDEGFLAGKKEGLRELDRTAQEKQDALAIVVSTVENNMQLMQQEYHNSIQQKQSDIGKLVITCADKLAREALRKDPIGDISDMIEACLDGLFDVPEVVANVHPDIAPLLQDKLPKIVTVNADKNIQLNDCNLSWKHGQAVRDSKQIWMEIEAIIERHFTSTATKEEYIQPIVEDEVKIEENKDNQEDAKEQIPEEVLEEIIETNEVKITETEINETDIKGENNE